MSLEARNVGGLSIYAKAVLMTLADNADAEGKACRHSEAAEKRSVAWHLWPRSPPRGWGCSAPWLSGVDSLRDGWVGGGGPLIPA